MQSTTHQRRPHFETTEDTFYQSIKKKAAGVIAEQKDVALRISWAKTIIYPALFLLAYAMLLLQGENLYIFYVCYGGMGILTTMIVFNIVHDAIHNSLFPRSAHNKRAMLLLDFLGGSSFIWSKRHVVLHHGFTNIPGWDIDIQQSIVVRFNEKQSFRKFNRYQFLYMPFIYLIYSLNWLLHRDFKDLFHPSSKVRQHFKIPFMEYIKLFASKFFYLIYIFIIPALLLPHTMMYFITGILFMHGLMSALTLLVLLPSHLDEHAQFPETDENLNVPNSWAIHQMKVTNDFGIDNRILNFIMGGLNHHIAHHLFPNVNHNIIPKITRHIYETARVHQVPYKSFTLGEVMTSHFKLLKRNSRELLEE